MYSSDCILYFYNKHNIELCNNFSNVWYFVFQYYLEKNLDARAKELKREAEVEEKAPKVKANSKMSKAEKEARKKQKMQAFQQAKQKSKASKNSKRWN